MHRPSKTQFGLHNLYCYYYVSVGINRHAQSRSSDRSKWPQSHSHSLLEIILNVQIKTKRNCGAICDTSVKHSYQQQDLAVNGMEISLHFQFYIPCVCCAVMNSKGLDTFLFCAFIAYVFT